MISDLRQTPVEGAAPEHRDDSLTEIAALFATGYLRLLLNAVADAPTPQHVATCGREDSALCAHEELDVLATQRDQL